MRPVDRNELPARRAHPDPPQALRRPACARTSQHSLELAVTDALTGLHNRRYFDSHLRPLRRPGREQRRGRCRC